ncbi:hypothetical protein HY495_02195 [Candidatus Woesearchaeota archaeon]|nr:hypothetical protein [Candidatus Woesearchaeota archaeon]
METDPADRLVEALEDIPSAQIPTLRRVQNASICLGVFNYKSLGGCGHDPKTQISDDVVRQRAGDIALAYKQRSILRDAQGVELEGILKPLAGGCRFVYYHQAELGQDHYSWEDLVLTSRPGLKGQAYRFQTDREPIMLRRRDGFIAEHGILAKLVDQYHLWRAGVSTE